MTATTGGSERRFIRFPMLDVRGTSVPTIQYRRMKPRRSINLVVLLAIVCSMLALRPAPALALDPARNLTQYLHRIWQVQQGLPEGTIYALHQSADGYLLLGT